MRVVRRVAERAVDPGLELLRERVLEPVGLRVHLVEAEPERLRQVLLEEPVVADDLECDPLAGGRQLDASVRSMLGQAKSGQTLQHRGYGGGPDAHALGSGDLVASRWEGRGKHTGELMGIAPTGKDAIVSGLPLSRVADGKIGKGPGHGGGL